MVCENIDSLSEYKDTVDNLIVFQSENLTFDIKSIIAEVTETVMVENDTARIDEIQERLFLLDKLKVSKDNMKPKAFSDVF